MLRHVLRFSAPLLLAACSTWDTQDEEKYPLTRTQTKQLRCLAEAIHGEARGEPEEGKIFVGQVVLTRVKKGYGKNYCDVVYARRQFAPKRNVSQASLRAAMRSEELGANGITHFHSYEQRSTPRASFSQTNKCSYKTKVGKHWGFTCNDGRTVASED